MLVTIPPAGLEGELILPPRARGIVVFAHGSGSSRHSPRNRLVAQTLQEAGLGTLLLDLLTTEEDAALRFDISFLADRLIAATDLLKSELPVGYFGASTGAAAALVAAARRRDIHAVVSRGGRPDLAEPELALVQAPTLLIVGGNDAGILELNQLSFRRLAVKQKQIQIVPGASHLFEEPGAIEQVAALARDWFAEYLNPK
ncbi:MAG: dienelactone hydrolase family protein [Acidobacteriota bacterium]|nr:dienelactone hydrolase family protein [Acidobacteriota bacterium]